MKKTLFILPLLLLAAVSCHKSSPSQTQLSATYIGSVSTGFEGYYKQTTYTFKYNPADFIFVSDPQNQSMLGIKDLKTNVEHGMQVFNNDGAGFRDSQHLWNNLKLCNDCKKINNNLSVKDPASQITYENKSSEFVVFQHDPGF